MGKASASPVASVTAPPSTSSTRQHHSFISEHVGSKQGPRTVFPKAPAMISGDALLSKVFYIGSDECKEHKTQVPTAVASSSFEGCPVQPVGSTTTLGHGHASVLQGDLPGWVGHHICPISSTLSIWGPIKVIPFSWSHKDPVQTHTLGLILLTVSATHSWFLCMYSHCLQEMCTASVQQLATSWGHCGA